MTSYCLISELKTRTRKIVRRSFPRNLVDWREEGDRKPHAISIRRTYSESVNCWEGVEGRHLAAFLCLHPHHPPSPSPYALLQLLLRHISKCLKRFRRQIYIMTTYRCFFRPFPLRNFPFSPNDAPGLHLLLRSTLPYMSERREGRRDAWMAVGGECGGVRETKIFSFYCECMLNDVYFGRALFTVASLRRRNGVRVVNVRKPSLQFSSATSKTGSIAVYKFRIEIRIQSIRETSELLLKWLRSELDGTASVIRSLFGLRVRCYRSILDSNS